MTRSDGPDRPATGEPPFGYRVERPWALAGHAGPDAGRTTLAGGTATGVDVWYAVDQAGSSATRCLASARALGAEKRVRVLTAELSDLLPDRRDHEITPVTTSPR